MVASDDEDDLPLMGGFPRDVSKDPKELSKVTTTDGKDDDGGGDKNGKKGGEKDKKKESDNGSDDEDDPTFHFNELNPCVLGPSLKKWFSTLFDTYGWKLCIMLIVSQHILKGFCMSYMGTSADWILRYYNVSGPRMQIYKACAFAPWSLKPIFGIVSDKVPFMGYRKTSYMALFTILAVVALSYMGIIGAIFYSHDESEESKVPLKTFLPLNGVVMIYFVFFAQVSICDLLTEARYAEAMRKNPERGPDLMTFVWLGISFGGMLGMGTIGVVLEKLGPFTPALICAPIAGFILYPLWHNYMQETKVNLPPEEQQLFEDDQPRISKKSSASPSKTDSKTGSIEKSKDSASPTEESKTQGEEEPAVGTVVLTTDQATSSSQQHDTKTGELILNTEIQKKSLNASKEHKELGPRLSKEASTGGGSKDDYVPQSALVADELIFLSILVGLCAIALVVVALFPEQITITHNFIIALVVGFLLLFGFHFFTSGPIANMNFFFFVQTSLAISTEGASFFFFTDDEKIYPDGPHFSITFYTTGIGIVAGVFNVVGMLIYQRCMKHWKYHALFIFANLIHASFSGLGILVFTRFSKNVLGINDHFFVLGGAVIVSIVHQWMWMPGVVLLSQFCPRGCEATMYALLAGCHNVGNAVGNVFGAYFCAKLGVQPDGHAADAKMFDKLWIVATIQTVLPLGTLFLLPWMIPNARQTDALLTDEDTGVNGSWFRTYFAEPYVPKGKALGHKKDDDANLDGGDGKIETDQKSLLDDAKEGDIENAGYAANTGEISTEKDSSAENSSMHFRGDHVASGSFDGGPISK